MSKKSQFPDEQSAEGEFARQEDAFRDILQPIDVEAGRYHLYISLACPWAHRTYIVRRLAGLEEAVGMTVVDPLRDDRGWAFREVAGAGRDPVNGFDYLAQAYEMSDPEFKGRVTVPVLWDKEENRIVNNSEDDICRMFNDQFSSVAENDIDLFPKDIQREQEELSEFIYDKINNGVYKAGFATNQTAYENAVTELFAALDHLEKRLETSALLFDNRIVETDWRLFCTLIRFDAVYVGHFKCNLRRIADYPQLSRYLKELYHVPGISQTVNLDHIKRHYYITHDDINPTGIVPLGPVLSL